MSRDLIFRAIIDNEELKNPHKLLLIALVRFGNHEGKEIFPGKALLARKLHCTQQWVKVLLKELERDGFIVTTNKKGGRGNVTHYEIVLSKLGIELESHDFTPPLSVTPPDNTYTNGYQPVTPPPQQSSDDLDFWRVKEQERFLFLEAARKRGDTVAIERHEEKLLEIQQKMERN